MSGITVIEIESDSPLERGRIYGENARGQIKNILNMYRDVLGTIGNADWDVVKGRLGPYLDCVKAFAPDLVQEIEGIAQGANCDFNDIFAINCRSEILFPYNPPDECSCLAVLPQASSEDVTLVAQNWDWYKSAIDNQVLLKISGNSGTPDLMTFTEAGQLAKIGVNQAGIGLCVTNLSPSVDGIGVPWIFITRKILESTHFTQAIGCVLGSVKGHSMNYLIAHTNGAVVDIESNPFSDHVIWPRDGVICHTNHYLQSSPHFVDLKTKNDPLPSTFIRYFRINEMLQKSKGDINEDKLKTILSDHFDQPYSVCWHESSNVEPIRNFITCLSIIIDLTNRKIKYLTGNPCSSEYKELCF